MIFLLGKAIPLKKKEGIAAREFGNYILFIDLKKPEFFWSCIYVVSALG